MLKAESRRLANEARARHPVSKEEASLNNNPPSFKSYPALGFSSSFLIFIGWMIILSGVLVLLMAVILPSGVGLVEQSLNQQSEYERTIITALGSMAVVVLLFFRIYLVSTSVPMIITGFALIANGETIKLFIDLQENADRQSIILTSLYKQLMAANRKDEQ